MSSAKRDSGEVRKIDIPDLVSFTYVFGFGCLLVAIVLGFVGLVSDEPMFFMNWLAGGAMLLSLIGAILGHAQDYKMSRLMEAQGQLFLMLIIAAVSLTLARYEMTDWRGYVMLAIQVLYVAYVFRELQTANH